MIVRSLSMLCFICLALAGPAGAVERGYAPVNGLKMYYEIHGSAARDRVPLVLLHGGDPTIGTSFSKLLPLLARSRRVIASSSFPPGSSLPSSTSSPSTAISSAASPARP